ncbi:hypothetical protein ADUPG1_010051 [Aduncisulcus paluster]|uniref:Uncharacterized protein n=1 Tax=Aduncisulcus paluster TaxID=2918883 RepID=A0ABQ5KXP5_9EUKA|nr:hypothetical protein ADUPG1_010051 [Aduncisulcus paluster]
MASPQHNFLPFCGSQQGIESLLPSPSPSVETSPNSMAGPSEIFHTSQTSSFELFQPDPARVMSSCSSSSFGVEQQASCHSLATCGEHAPPKYDCESHGATPSFTFSPGRICHCSYPTPSCSFYAPPTLDVPQCFVPPTEFCLPLPQPEFLPPPDSPRDAAFYPDSSDAPKITGCFSSSVDCYHPVDRFPGKQRYSSTVYSDGQYYDKFGDEERFQDDDEACTDRHSRDVSGKEEEESTDGRSSSRDESPSDHKGSSSKKPRAKKADNERWYNSGMQCGLGVHRSCGSFDKSSLRKRSSKIKPYYDALCTSQETGVTYKNIKDGFFKNKKKGFSKFHYNHQKQFDSKFRLVLTSVTPLTTKNVVDSLIRDVCGDLSEPKKDALAPIIFTPLNEWLCHYRFSVPDLLRSLDAVSANDFKLRAGNGKRS